MAEPTSHTARQATTTDAGVPLTNRRPNRGAPVDEDIASHVNRLVEEEHELRAHAAGEPVDVDRLQRIEVELDQCWDLLRQRRARRSVGLDPDDASARPAEIVEHYRG